MNTVLIFASLVVLATAATQTQFQAPPVHILRYENDNNGIGGYNFGFDTSDGVSRQETAEVRNAGSEQESLAVKGSYSWTADDGQVYTIHYIADENGFQPQGSHIPNN